MQKTESEQNCRNKKKIEERYFEAILFECCLFGSEYNNIFSTSVLYWMLQHTTSVKKKKIRNFARTHTMHIVGTAEWLIQYLLLCRFTEVINHISLAHIQTFTKKWSLSTACRVLLPLVRNSAEKFKKQKIKIGNRTKNMLFALNESSTIIITQLVSGKIVSVMTFNLNATTYIYIDHLSFHS